MICDVADVRRTRRANLIERARRGDQEAWQRPVRGMLPEGGARGIRRRMRGRGRRLYDSTDIANDVMKSLAEKFNHIDFSSIHGLRRNS